MDDYAELSVRRAQRGSPVDAVGRRGDRGRSYAAAARSYAQPRGRYPQQYAAAAAGDLRQCPGHWAWASAVASVFGRMTTGQVDRHGRADLRRADAAPRGSRSRRRMRRPTSAT